MQIKKNQGKINFCIVGANFLQEFSSSDIFVYYSNLSNSQEFIFADTVLNWLIIQNDRKTHLSISV